ncbi:hypothetical protein [Gelidibacter salicanalis]|uniref:Uncharacterized protein n=1 Tax=Gelidibacter salicanalis TaxID=291193 RepID=A0A934KRQ5_9FLAO|nr:hypothetical protein [Gelidibacter salicanalis]MBJ7880211.1 hypothetical protein [Gelidibacter salicanalis]
MKKYKILAFFFAFALIISSCEDTFENRVESRGVAVVPVLSDVNPAFYTTDLSGSFVKFTVALEDGDTVDAAEVQITYEGKTEILQDITSFPSTITVAASDALTALGLTESEVEVDDFFLIQVVTTSGGITTRSLASLKVFVTCEFDPVLTEGSYHVVSDSWEVEGDVTLTADPDDPYLIGVTGLFEMEGGAPNNTVLYLNINPSNFSVSGVKTILGPTAPWGAYNDYAYTPVSGLYKSCTGSFEMKFAITVAQGGFGSFDFVFTKN